MNKKIKMYKNIITLTLNPAIDKSTQFSGLKPEQKLRCFEPHFDAGGGGVNVSKAIKKLGGESKAILTSGGHTGAFLEQLLQNEGLNFETIKINNPSRENFIAVDTITGLQYRFGLPGPVITPVEQDKIIGKIVASPCDFLVASGSLPAGIEPGWYANLIHAKKETKVILDTSGEALKQALEAGVYLIKPNLGELASLVNVSHLDKNDIADAASQIIAKGQSKIVVVSMGADGAWVASESFNGAIPAPKVQVKSTVGAGDSMVGGMVWALSQGKSIKEAAQYGVACGSAATMNEGTQLFKIEDVNILLGQIKKLMEK